MNETWKIHRWGRHADLNDLQRRCDRLNAQQRRRAVPERVFWVQAFDTLEGEAAALISRPVGA